MFLLVTNDFAVIAESADTSVDSASSADSLKRAGGDKLDCNVILFRHL